MVRNNFPDPSDCLLQQTCKDQIENQSLLLHDPSSNSENPWPKKCPF